MNASEMLPSQRAAIIAWHLAHGETFRTRQIAEMFDIPLNRAFLLMSILSQCIPIYVEHGVWQVCALRDETD